MTPRCLSTVVAVLVLPAGCGELLGIEDPIPLTWHNQALTPQSATLTWVLDAVPAANDLNVVIGLSHGIASAYTDVAVIISFGPSGAITVRDGGRYTAAAVVAYSAGSSYHLVAAVDIPARTYSVHVTPQGQSTVTLASNAAFRTEQQSVAVLDNLAIGDIEPGIVNVSSSSVSAP